MSPLFEWLLDTSWVEVITSVIYVYLNLLNKPFQSSWLRCWYFSTTRITVDHPIITAIALVLKAIMFETLLWRLGLQVRVKIVRLSGILYCFLASKGSGDVGVL